MVRGQWANLAMMPELHPLLFFEGHPEIFNDHRGPRFNVSSERRCIYLVDVLFFYSIVSPSLYLGIRTHTDHRVSTPCWPY